MRPTACQEQGAGRYTEGAGTLKNCLLFVHTTHRELLVNGEIRKLVIYLEYRMCILYENGIVWVFYGSL